MHAMKDLGLAAVVGSVLFGAAPLGAADGEKISILEVGGRINWVYSYEEGKRRARETGRPLFVIFRCER